MSRINVVRRLAFAGMLLAFCVVVFGAYVRLSDAGLGCPDWPGCYGHVTPAQAAAAEAGTIAAPLHVGKAWREMIHRYGASTLGLVILVIAGLAWRWRRQPGMPLGLPLSLLWWLWLSLRRRSTSPWSGSVSALGGGSAAAMLLPASPAVRRVALIALLALAVQIILGGWTSTNYAAVACPDFPTCQAYWWPDADY